MVKMDGLIKRNEYREISPVCWDPNLKIDEKNPWLKLNFKEREKTTAIEMKEKTQEYYRCIGLIFFEQVLFQDPSYSWRPVYYRSTGNAAVT